MAGYLITGQKEQCYGCEACVQICPHKAIFMKTDSEGFRYPSVCMEACVHCGLCHSACPVENPPSCSHGNPIVFGGRHKEKGIRESSTSGGVFTALAQEWFDGGGVVFGAQAKGLQVFHTCIAQSGDLKKIRRSKYIQSHIGDSFRQVRDFLSVGRKVLFSGTPCQIAGLKTYLGNASLENLLTVEVICEGVPSPLFIQKYSNWIEKRYRIPVCSVDYRYKDKRKWDFQVMRVRLQDGRCIKTDRRFNPYWHIWLSHLMSRPSCYECPFACRERIADLSLGDLWGVHIYCPELYGGNQGASLILCNTQKGRDVLRSAGNHLCGHRLDFEAAVRYQSPLRSPIIRNPQRETFLEDLRHLDYRDLCKKWYPGPSLVLLWQKYVWGNRQKVFCWAISQKLIALRREKITERSVSFLPDQVRPKNYL